MRPPSRADADEIQGPSRCTPVRPNVTHAADRSCATSAALLRERQDPRATSARRIPHGRFTFTPQADACRASVCAIADATTPESVTSQTSRWGEGKRSAVFTSVFGAGALLVDRACVLTSCLGVGMSTRTDGLPSPATLTSPPRDRPRPVSVCTGATAFTRILSGASSR